MYRDFGNAREHVGAIEGLVGGSNSDRASRVLGSQTILKECRWPFGVGAGFMV